MVNYWTQKFTPLCIGCSKLPSLADWKILDGVLLLIYTIKKSLTLAQTVTEAYIETNIDKMRITGKRLIHRWMF